MQPDLENIKQRVQENRDFISRITTKLPGFKGYVEKDELTDVDRILRKHLADAIQGYKTEVNSLSGQLFKKGQTDLLGDVESLTLTMEKLIKKCSYADFASSADLAGAKISEEDQNRLLEYDWRLISTVEELEPAVKALFEDDTDVAAGIKDLSGKLKEFEKLFDDRKNVLTEVI